MKNLKNLTFLLILISSSLLPYSINAQSFISVTPGNLQQSVEDIYMAYGNQIELPSNQVQGFLQTFFPSNAIGGCTPIAPFIAGESPSDITFQWQSIQPGALYRAGFINLNSGQDDMGTTPNTKLFLDNMEPDLYLFAFQTKCSSGESGIYSSVNLIIVDKAILQNLEEGNCNCDKKTTITYDGPTATSSVSIPWNSDCEYTKYKIKIEGTLNGLPFVSCAMVIHEEGGGITNGLDNVYVLPNCGQNIDFGPGSFVGYTDYYGITFTSWGMIVYLTPNTGGVSFEIDKITITNCNCNFENRPGERPGNGIAVLARTADEANEIMDNDKLQIKAFPNPTENEANLNYTLETAAEINISLHETTGKVLQTIVDQRQEKGNYNQYIDLSSYPPGIYHIVLNIGDQYQALRLVKQ